ncbi:MAG: bifunctional helix-turn-helix transcriptional regulator/GNAT family N-acetyltransferase [Alphaproteobacteria bacterium]|nr:bifunctional helix-turn-helix transcriptional regulator/GNAT family N-acetyltransferase [Alphaproteobacteria bacterium]
MTGDNEYIAAIRAFNRFYTRVIGLLDEGILKSPFSLAEARVVYDIGRLGRTTAADLARALAMDPGQLSRLLARLTERSLVASTPRPEDGRAADLSLTSAGEAARAELDGLSDRAAAALVAPLPPPRRAALVDAMQAISNLLGEHRSGDTVLRDHTIGELGWLIQRQGQLYHEEQGWNGAFEALIAKIYAEFAEAPETPPKRLWIAERAGAVAGSIFVVPYAGEAGTAQLRMLYVEPWARGGGLGQRLVDEAVRFSRAAGYRRIMLWTQDCLTAARRIYQGAGFTLAREEKHHSFGVDLNGQFWELDLRT